MFMGVYIIKNRLRDLAEVDIVENSAIKKLRKNTEVLIIDDDDFAYLDAFIKHGFSVTQKNDIHELKDVEPYQVILCDIRGVGQKFNASYEGAYLIKEFKKNYPTKTVISYTASDYDTKYEKFLKFADNIIPKGTALEDWIEILDEAIRSTVNPIVQWKRMRLALLEADVDTIRVAELENAYVSAIKNHNFTTLKKLQEKSSGDVKNIICGLIEIVRYILENKK